MAAKRNGLGKGLDSLIPTKSDSAAKNKENNKTDKLRELSSNTSGEVMVKITEVEPNREQPRKDFDEDALLELSLIHI